MGSTNGKILSSQQLTTYHKKIMNTITYPEIESLISNVNVEGRTVQVEFSTPSCETPIASSATAKRGNSMGDKVKSQVKNQVVNEVKRGVSRLMRGIFGSGTVGRVVNSTTNSVTNSASQSIRNAPSQSEKEEAIVEAFLKVSNQFTKDNSGQWIISNQTGAEKSSDAFSKQLEEGKIESSYDQEILSRILANIAAADNDIKEEEKEFFSSFIPESIGDLESILKKDSVSKIEAEAVSSGAKQSIYMLAWVMACVDFDLEADEQEQVRALAELFDLSNDNAEQLEILAKSHLLKGVLNKDISRDELFSWADKLELDHNSAERAKIEWLQSQ